MGISQNGSSSTGITRPTYATIELRDAAITSLRDGTIVYVVDATGDATVTSGGAYYEYLGSGTDFRKLSEEESNNLNNVFGASGLNHSKGLVPDPGAVAGTNKFLREDGTWQVPSSGGPAIAASYADIATRDADEANRTSGEVVRVTDATGDSTVGEGGAYYEYLGSSSWRKLSEDESANYDSGWFTGTFGATTDLDLQNLAFPKHEVTADATSTDLTLTNVKADADGRIRFIYSGITNLTVNLPAGYTHKGATGTITSFVIGANDGEAVTVEFYVKGTIIEWFYPSGDKATNTSAGLVKLSTAADDPTDPISVGTNDVRLIQDGLVLSDDVGMDGKNAGDLSYSWTIAATAKNLNVSNFRDNGNYQIKGALSGVTEVTITLGGSGYTHVDAETGTSISSISYYGADGSKFELNAKVYGTEIWWTMGKSRNVAGTATLVAGTVTVNENRVTSNSIIQLTRQSTNAATAYGVLVLGTVTAGTSFVIRSEDPANPANLIAGDTSIVGYVITESV